MSAKVLFACSKCFSRHPFEELSIGQQLCKSCRGSSVIKCNICRTEFHSIVKSQTACKKCEYNVSKYGKPTACECCKIVAAFGGSKCMRCASYEAKYGQPVQCDECKQRSAFDKHDENKKLNGKLMCWLCTSAYKRAVAKAQQDGRIITKKRSHDKSHKESSSSSNKKMRSTGDAAKSSVGVIGNASSTMGGIDASEKLSRSSSSGVGGSNSNSTGIGGLSALTAPAAVDPNSTDHVIALTQLKERIASLERRLNQKDKELLERDKLISELKGRNLEKEIEMRNKLKETERFHELKIEHMNRKVTGLLKEVAALTKSSKKNGAKEPKDRDGRDSVKEELCESSAERKKLDKELDERDDKSSAESRSNSPLTI